MRHIRVIILSVVLSIFLVGCQNTTREVEPAKIKMPDVVGMQASEAITTLEQAGFASIFSNVQLIPGRDDINWLVIEQNLEANKEYEQSEIVELKCIRNYKLRINVVSDKNLLFNKYDIDLYLDNDAIGSVSNGDTFSIAGDVWEGEHVFKAVKSGSSSTKDETTINVSADTKFTATIDHGGNIKLKDIQIEYDEEGFIVAMPGVEHLLLSEAIEELNLHGFSNVSYKIITDIDDPNEDDWIVVEQGTLEGSLVDKYESVVLSIDNLVNYVAEILSKASLGELQEWAQINGFEIKYVDSEMNQNIDETIHALAEEQKQYWKIDSISRSDTKELEVIMTYLGTPEENAAKAEKEAAEKKREEELKQKRIELLQYFPIDIAKKVLSVAFTNYFAEDIFAEDGNSYELEKFHGYEYSGEYKNSITKDGIWTVADGQTWMVEDIYLKKKGVGNVTRVASAKITYNGENYIVGVARFITGDQKEVESGDVSKISGWTTISPDAKKYPFLTISQELLDKKEEVATQPVNQTQAETSPTVVVPSKSEPAYSVSPLSKTMYAKQAANVRSGPGTNYDKVGGVALNEEVQVTGESSGWYRIKYKSTDAFIKGSLLSDQKTVVAASTGGGSSSTSGGSSNATVAPANPAPVPSAPASSYVANTSSKKFHYPSCGSVKKMAEHNKWYFTGSRDELVAQGYSPCGNCHP